MAASSTSGEVTLLLEAIARSDESDDGGVAMDRLFALVYDQLHREARRQHAGWIGARTLNTTALVHEAYEKLLGTSELGFRDRAHFLAVAGRAMRQILLDYAKGQLAEKRGGDRHRVSLQDNQISNLAAEPQIERLITLDDALGRLEAFNPDGARVVECRFFAGMTVEETAAALRVSEPTVKRRWRAARAWLHSELEGRDLEADTVDPSAGE